MTRERGTDYQRGYKDGYRDGYEKGRASRVENRSLDFLSPYPVLEVPSSETRLEAVRKLSRLNLPVGDPEPDAGD